MGAAAPPSSPAVCAKAVYRYGISWYRCTRASETRCRCEPGWAGPDCSAASPLALAAGSIEAEVQPTEFLEMDGSTFSCGKFRGGAQGAFSS